MTAADFIAHWKDSAGAELANSQSFLIHLCDLLEVPRPEPTVADEQQNVYTFEKAVTFHNGDGTTSRGRVDLYKRGCFVLESKQGSERRAAEQAEALATVTRQKQKKLRTGTAQRGTAHWQQAMMKARKQAEGYAKALPDWPPFLIVADVGHCFDLYADFSGTGKLYQPFPDPKNYRIQLADLAHEEVRKTLRTIWLDPHALDPSKRSAKVTRDLAARLAKLARSLEQQTGPKGEKLYPPEDVAQFLMRCLFTMFAEDVELIPKESFTSLLESLRETPQGFAPTVEALWRDMNTGSDFSPILRTQLRQFNGGLFENQAALPLNRDQLELLIEAAKANWREVEPAIFGTLLERALDPHERHKLGAHYTPRAYVERLVMPTIIEPLREEWDETYAAAAQLRNDGKTGEAIGLIRRFLLRLCSTKVLDPACGSGNFLYVALELMKRLEGEVRNALKEFGDLQKHDFIQVDPHLFLGIEVNPRAAAITDLVLWIGYLQWHFRTSPDGHINEPIVQKFHNIECRDAVLDWDAVEPVTDAEGNPVTRWDGRTTKPHPVTGEEVPDETARVQELRYVNPRKAEWPEAEFIVGNPPFIGNKRMRKYLGDGYVKAIRTAWPELKASSDFVMYWWHHAAVMASVGDVSRFGFITTNSITQKLNRWVVTDAMARNLSLVMAIPDHPWIDAAWCASVRIAMTVGQGGEHTGILSIVTKELETDPENPTVLTNDRRGKIRADLTIGTSTDDFVKLQANQGLAFRGVIVGGNGLLLEGHERDVLPEAEQNIVRPFLSGRDVTQRSRNLYAIDLFPTEEPDAVREEYGALFQRLYNTVRSARQEQSNEWRKKHWWLFSDPARGLRRSLTNLTRYIITARTSEHRFFSFVDVNVCVESEVIAIASGEAYLLGCLSARPHLVFATFVPGAMGVGNQDRYMHSERFPQFPFPCTETATRGRIANLAEQLDAHRKRQQEKHPGLTMTGMYNVLEKLRSGEALTTKEQAIHEQGLVSVLKQIHDELDAAVFDAYGWPHDLTDEQILERLVALNHERAEEERRGLVRWLRPEFQNPGGTSQTQLAAEAKETTKKAAPKGPKAKKEPWPKKLPEQIRALRRTLAEQPAPASPEELARRFTRARTSTVEELLETLVEVGQARVTDDGRFAA